MQYRQHRKTLTQISRRQFVGRCGAAATTGLTALALGRMPAVAREADRPLEVGLAPQLFLDDAVVDRVENLTRQFHPPRKEGLIREADGSSWQHGDQLSVVRDAAGKFHMTYRFTWSDPSVRDLHEGIGEDRAHWFRLTTAYATSDDGIHWHKPMLGLMDGPSGFRPAPRAKWADGVFLEPSGFSRENNLGSPIHILQDLGLFGGVSDPQRRYQIQVMFRDDTHNFARITDGGLYFADRVPDIVGDADWRKRLAPIWEGARGGPRGPSLRVAGYDAQAKLWFECTQSTIGRWVKRDGRNIARFTSPDLKEWSSEELVLPVADDESTDPADYIEYMDIRVCRVADVWLGQLIIFHSDRTSRQYEMPTIANVWRKGTTEMRLIVSRDAGKTWSRVGGKTPWIPFHPADDGYDRLVFTGSPVRVGDELWLYYGCWDGDHLVWNRDGTTYYKDRARIGRTARAVARWNGFVSLRARDSSGRIVTRPLLLAGTRLRINAAARGGTIRVGLVGPDGNSLPGYAVSDCAALSSDGVAQIVRWAAAEALPMASRGVPVRLRFELEEADLFGFEFAG